MPLCNWLREVTWVVLQMSFDAYLDNTTTFLNGLTHHCTLEIDSRDGRQVSSRCYSNTLSAGVQALLVQDIAVTGFYTMFRGGSGGCIPVRASFSIPVQTRPGTHTVSCAMGTGSLSRGVKRPGRGVHHLSRI
jgi:hypothetical protein